MRRFFEPASAPAWLKPVLGSVRAALGDVWDVPLRPFQAATRGAAAGGRLSGRAGLERDDADHQLVGRDELDRAAAARRRPRRDRGAGDDRVARPDRQRRLGAARDRGHGEPDRGRQWRRRARRADPVAARPADPARRAAVRPGMRSPPAPPRAIPTPRSASCSRRRPGSSFDFFLAGADGNAILQVPTGTRNPRFPAERHARRRGERQPHDQRPRQP